jgi:hypothetical protein
MNPVDKALATQLANIEKRTGKTLGELTALVKASGLTKHGAIRDMLKKDLGMGHGDANTVTHVALSGTGQPSAAAEAPAADDAVAAMYVGPKAALKPIHDALMAKINAFGEFETSPKKGYVSLRRKKQFATVGPATNTRVEVGLNMKGVKATDRLEELPPKSMCQYRVKLGTVEEVDKELVAWIRQAFDAAG